MSKKLLIVESPAKAKTIGKDLGGEFVVKSSVGHIRDLPKENGAIRIEEAGENKWSFTPKYVVSEGKTKVVNELKEHFQEMVFNTVIQRSIRLSEAPSHGKPIILYDVVSNGTTNYMNLAKEVLEKNER